MRHLRNFERTKCHNRRCRKVVHKAIRKALRLRRVCIRQARALRKCKNHRCRRRVRRRVRREVHKSRRYKAKMRKYRKKQFAKKFVPVPQYGKGAKTGSTAAGSVPSAEEAAAMVAAGGKSNAAQPNVGIFPAPGPARSSSSSVVAISVALLAGAISLIAML